MSAWRVIITDSESLTGVAPVCPQPHPLGDGVRDFENWVYDCCPGPHIECGNQHVAEAVANMLTAADAEVCP
jgi:hypothetical protein